MYSKEQREKRMNKINRTQRKVGHRLAKQYILNGVPKGEEREREEKLF